MEILTFFLGVFFFAVISIQLAFDIQASELIRMPFCVLDLFSSASITPPYSGCMESSVFYFVLWDWGMDGSAVFLYFLLLVVSYLGFSGKLSQ